MPRAEVELGGEWEAELAKRLVPVLSGLLEKEALSEKELFEKSLSALGLGSAKELAPALKRLYSLQYRKKLSDRTAAASVMRSLRGALEAAKKELLVSGRFGATGRKFQFGKKNHGRVFFPKKDGSDEMVGRKVAELVKKSQGCASHILAKLERDGFVPEAQVPFQRRSVQLAGELLANHGLAKISQTPAGRMIHKPGFDIANARLHDRRPKTVDEAIFGTGVSVWKDFDVASWALGPEGPEVVRFRFWRVGFDRKTGVLHVADSCRGRCDVSPLRGLREKSQQWGLPAVAHVFAPSFTAPAGDYARRWGIRLHETRAE